MNFREIHLWVPGWNPSEGGIQAYSSFMARALAEVLPATKLRVFSKNDSASPAGDLPRHVTAQHFGRWPARMRTIAFSAAAYRAAISCKPDLILSTLVNFAPLAERIAARTFIPYWLVAHGVDVWGRTDASFVASLRAAQRILCVSRYTRDRLASEQQIDPSQLTLQPNTFDHNRFGIRPKPDYLLQRYRLSADQPIIFTLARLSKAEGYKGYDRVIQAMVEVKKQLPNAHYILGGKGDDLDRLRALASELGLRESITFAGFIPDTELADHYALCDLFAMPSKGEGFGIVFLEALASGRPVLAGNRDGSVDPLMDGEVGVLVDPDNISAIAQSLVDILARRHPNTLLYQPEKLRERVIARFGFDSFKDTLVANLNSFAELRHKAA